MTNKIIGGLEDLITDVKGIVRPTSSPYYDRALEQYYTPRDIPKVVKTLKDAGINDKNTLRYLVSYGNGLSKDEINTVADIMKYSKNKNKDSQLIADLVNKGYLPEFIDFLYKRNYKKAGKPLSDALTEIKNSTNAQNPSPDIINRVNYLTNNYLPFDKMLELASKKDPRTQNLYTLESMIRAVNIVDNTKFKGLPISAYIGVTEGIARVEDKLQSNGSEGLSDESYESILKVANELYRSGTNMANLVYGISELYTDKILDRYNEKDGRKLLEKLGRKAERKGKYGTAGLSYMDSIFQNKY